MQSAAAVTLMPLSTFCCVYCSSDSKCFFDGPFFLLSILLAEVKPTSGPHR